MFWLIFVLICFVHSFDLCTKYTAKEVSEFDFGSIRRILYTSGALFDSIMIPVENHKIPATLLGDNILIAKNGEKDIIIASNSHYFIFYVDGNQLWMSSNPEFGLC